MKMNYIKLWSLLLVLSVVTGCKKNDPIADLGDTNGEYVAMLNVSYNINQPSLGDTVIVTASTWQKDDKIASLEMTETVVEKLGIKLKLKHGTDINTLDMEKNVATLVITDSILVNNPWYVIKNDNNQLNAFFETITNNYVVRAKYPYERKEGNYPLDNTLVTSLNDADFEVLKSILAYSIIALDYKELYPNAPASHFATNGAYVLSQEGINNLKATLTKQMLAGIIEESNTTGVYNVELATSVYTPTGAVRTVSRNFQTNF